MAKADGEVAYVSPAMEEVFQYAITHANPFDVPTLRQLIAENSKDINTEKDWDPALREFMLILDKDIKALEKDRP